MSSKLILPPGAPQGARPGAYSVHNAVQHVAIREDALLRVQQSMPPAHPFFRFDESVEWSVTDQWEIAHENGYLGEETVKARRLPLAIHYLCTGKVLPAIHLFFFGRPDEVVADRFGWLDAKVQVARGEPTRATGTLYQGATV